MSSLAIKNAIIINRNTRFEGDIFIKNGRIEQIAPVIDKMVREEIDAKGMIVMPGIIDDQVHFREPGLTHKANIYTESRAAVAGGVTSFMEMPNTKPPALTQELLEEKYKIAEKTSLANYSFFMGAGNDNLDEVLKTDGERICGVKVFMGSSTGNMLVDEPSTLEALFQQCPLLIATHCEDEKTIKANEADFRERFGENVPMEMHPQIRSAEACYLSSSLAIGLAKKYGTRLHILHISTKDELSLFDNENPLEKKRITSEVCVHHLYFKASDYARLGSQIKCNPAVKSEEHHQALLPALLDDRLDIIATDHAPHSWEEKQQTYFNAPSGVPLVQHSLNVMLELYHQGQISLEKIVEKMCHAPAVCFRLRDRGYIDEGFWADMAIVDPNREWKVSKENILYKCNWSPFEGHTFRGKVMSTLINGHVAWGNGALNDRQLGQRLLFQKERK